MYPSISVLFSTYSVSCNVPPRTSPATYAPVMSATPKIFSATYAYIKQIQIAKMGTRRLCGYFCSILLNALRSKIPSATAMTKNVRFFRQTNHHWAFTHHEGKKELSGILSLTLPLNPVKTERIIMPRISSMTAAASRVGPTLVLSFPSSLSVATVTETEVAVNIAP